jgi:RNA polymerase sigma-70 factor (ECF subfamily)
MGEQPESQTRATLLARLYRSGAADADAWREFVNIYGRQIYKWCRHWGLQDTDAEDMTQQVLLQLLTKMKEFVYDPQRSFRAWLKTVTYHAWQNMLSSRRHNGAGGADSHVWEQLLTVPARDDLALRLEHEFDRELLEEAMLRVAPHNWEAYRLTALEGVPARETAQRLSMKIANVYAARSNVQRLLREQVEKLEAAQGSL